MPEYVRPNLSIPSGVWGEVKVSAFRRGMKVNEVVVEALRKAFGGSGGEKVGLLVKDSTKPVSVEKKATVKSDAEFTCAICFKPTEGTYLCKECAK